MEILGEDECIDLLRQVPVGRIAVTVDALPVIFPITIAVVDGAVVFRTPPGTKGAQSRSRWTPTRPLGAPVGASWSKGWRPR
jgi:nitroimidazol reductase NimA-like FMN-containing flavoprotein (pyridoxamine 5'-phosphate oxidase superfamily)